jgi:hypothetical protein
MSTEIIIDPNVRTAGNRTYAGFEDVRGGFVDDLSPGDAVTAVEEESDVIGEAVVCEVNHEKHLIYLDVDWSTLRPRPQVEAVALSNGWTLLRATLTTSLEAANLGAGVTSSAGVDRLLLSGVG